MLHSRQPLKPSLIVFAAVHEQTRELLGFINNRLARFPDEQAAFFLAAKPKQVLRKLHLGRQVVASELQGLSLILFTFRKPVLLRELLADPVVDFWVRRPMFERSFPMQLLCVWLIP